MKHIPVILVKLKLTKILILKSFYLLQLLKMFKNTYILILFLCLSHFLKIKIKKALSRKHSLHSMCLNFGEVCDILDPYVVVLDISELIRPKNLVISLSGSIFVSGKHITNTNRGL